MKHTTEHYISTSWNSKIQLYHCKNELVETTIPLSYIHSKYKWAVFTICLLPELHKYIIRAHSHITDDYTAWLPSFLVQFVYIYMPLGEGREAEHKLVANIKWTLATYSKNTQQVFLHGCHDTATALHMYDGLMFLLVYIQSVVLLDSLVVVLYFCQ